jgi:hypothetical protein
MWLSARSIGCQKAFENSPWAKTSAVAILTMRDVETVSTNSQKVECTATVLMNSAKGVLNYSFTKDPSLGNARYYVRASLDVDSLKPHP